MRRGLGVALVASLLTGGAVDLRVARSASPPAPPHPAPPLPMLPSVARVRLDVARTHVVVEEDVSLPRGGYRGGTMDLFVAFGAPGAPLAFDAHLVPVADGALEADHDARGETLTTSRAPRRPGVAHELLGPQTMAGEVVHVDEATLRRALAPGGMAALRVRYVVALPEASADGGREVLVRLGEASGTPLTLGRLQIATTDAPIARVEAHLCGPEADPYPLAIARVAPDTKPAAAPAATLSANLAPRQVPAPIAPVLAVRHASDDLCIRFWTERHDDDAGASSAATATPSAPPAEAR